MNRFGVIFTGYLVGAWLTFGYTSMLWGERVAGVPNGLIRWDVVGSTVISVVWPIYWFCVTGMWVFGG